MAQAFKLRLTAGEGKQAILGCIDAGNKCYWWDYGLLALYTKNNLLLTKDSAEAHALRTFLQVHLRAVCVMWLHQSNACGVRVRTGTLIAISLDHIIRFMLLYVH